MLRIPLQISLLLALLTLLSEFDYSVFDVGVESVWNVDILLVAETHVGKVHKHHRDFVLSYITCLTQIEDLKYVQIKLLVFRST